jgi:hypothetical protein
MVIGSSPPRLFRRVHEQTELFDPVIVDLVVFRKKRLELRGIEIAHAEQ